MKNIVNLYKEISNNLIDILKSDEVDNDKLDKYLDERHQLLTNVAEEEKSDFIKEYKCNLESIDIEINRFLQNHLDDSKRELANFRKNQNGNIAYANMNKTKLNIFYKKV